jgi:hypothetical protein
MFYCVEYNVLLCPVQCSIVYSTGFYCVQYNVLLFTVQGSIVYSTMFWWSLNIVNVPRLLLLSLVHEELHNPAPVQEP